MFHKQFSIGSCYRHVEKCMRSKFAIESFRISTECESCRNSVSRNNVKYIWNISSCKSGIQDAMNGLYGKRI